MDDFDGHPSHHRLHATTRKRDGHSRTCPNLSRLYGHHNPIQYRSFELPAPQ